MGEQQYCSRSSHWGACIVRLSILIGRRRIQGAINIIQHAKVLYINNLHSHRYFIATLTHDYSVQWTVKQSFVWISCIDCILLKYEFYAENLTAMDLVHFIVLNRILIKPYSDSGLINWTTMVTLQKYMRLYTQYTKKLHVTWTLQCLLWVIVIAYRHNLDNRVLREC